ncbi:Uncharacterised protein [Vibrio cholerae]|nr:Uncharacterised protein [Vibrio cholerae]
MAFCASSSCNTLLKSLFFSSMRALSLSCSNWVG